MKLSEFPYKAPLLRAMAVLSLAIGPDIACIQGETVQKVTETQTKAEQLEDPEIAEEPEVLIKNTPVQIKYEDTNGHSINIPGIALSGTQISVDNKDIPRNLAYVPGEILDASQGNSLWKITAGDTISTDSPLNSERTIITLSRSLTITNKQQAQKDPFKNIPTAESDIPRITFNADAYEVAPEMPDSPSELQTSQIKEEEKPVEKPAKPLYQQVKHRAQSPTAHTPKPRQPKSKENPVKEMPATTNPVSPIASILSQSGGHGANNINIRMSDTGKSHLLPSNHRLPMEHQKSNGKIQGLGRIDTGPSPQTGKNSAYGIGTMK